MAALAVQVTFPFGTSGPPTTSVTDTASGTTLTLAGGDGFVTFLVVGDASGLGSPTNLSGNVATTNGPMATVRLSIGGGAFDLVGLTLFAHPSDTAGNNALTLTTDRSDVINVTFTSTSTAADVRTFSDARLQGVTYVDITRQDAGVLTIALDNVVLNVGGGGGSTPQTITFANPGAQGFCSPPTLTATSDSSLTVSFTSSTTGVCTITSGGVLTFVTTGTCTINADQAGNGTYAAAPQVSRSFSVNGVVPGAPTIGTATAGDTQASVAFTAPACMGGSSITSYTATANPGGATGTSATSPITVTGLTNGVPYTFTVTATNGTGTSSASGPSNSVTPAAVDATAPTLPAANIVVNNQSDPHKVILTFSESLNAAIGLPGAWSVTGNPGTPAYSIASVALSPANTVTLTLAAVDLSNPATYITNAAAAAHVKVTPNAAVRDLASNTYAAGMVTEAGATHVLDATAPTFPMHTLQAQSTSGVTIVVNSASEKARGYWMVVPLSSVAPNGGQVIAGVNYGAVTVVASGSGVLPGGSIGLLTVSGLAAGTTYDLFIVLVDAAGNQSAVQSNTFNTLASVPGAPTITSVTAGSGQATVSFLAPSSGAAITSYTATCTGGSPLQTVSITSGSTSIVVSPLANGTTYSCTVSASSTSGAGPASAAMSVTPSACASEVCRNGGLCMPSGTSYFCRCADGFFGPVCENSSPGAPTNVVAVANDKSATVSWTAPASNGGSVITQYIVTTNTGMSVSTSTTSVVVTGLINGLSYSFTVVARNAFGAGPASDRSNAVTPKAAQTITFEQPADLGLGTSTTLTAMASSGLPVSFSSSTLSVCTITPTGALTLITTGTCTITASQGGNESFLAAPNVPRSFTVASPGFTVQPAVSGTPTATRLTISFTTAVNDIVRCAAYSSASGPNAAAINTGTGTGYVASGGSTATTAGSSATQTIGGLASATQYYVYCSTTSGVVSTVVSVATAGFTVPPALSGTPTATAATLSFTTALTEIVGCAVYTTAQTLSWAQFWQGTSGAQEARRVPATGGSATTLSFASLLPATEYHAYCATESGALSAAVRFSTAGFSAHPTISGTPSANSLTVAFTVAVTENVRCSAYSAAGGFTANQVYTGTNVATGGTGWLAGGTAASANAGTSTTQTISGLTAGTTYFVYCATATSGVVSTVVTVSTAGFTVQPAVSGTPTATSVRVSFVSGATEIVRCGAYASASSPSADAVNAGIGAAGTAAASATAGTATTFALLGLSASTTYFIYCATASGIVSTGVQASTAGFTVQPTVSGTPTATSVTVSFTVGATESVRCSAYSTASGPTAANVNGGTGTNFVASGTAASATGGTATTQVITGLTAGTTYFVYCATATSLVVSNGVSVTTAAAGGFSTQPAVSGTPGATSVTLSYTTVVTENVRCSAYSTASSPTAAQVNSGAGTRFVASGTASLATAGVSTTQTISGLNPGTTYFAYCATATSLVVSSVVSFSTASARTLSVTVSGGGTVTSTPAGIDCGTTCSAQFSPDATVTLTATPASGAVLVFWTGACSGTATNTCNVVVPDRDLTVGATFGTVAAAAGAGANVPVWLASLYQNLFGRDPQRTTDNDEVGYWVGQVSSMRANGLSASIPALVVNAFVASQEYGLPPEPSVIDFVTHLYQGLLGRRPGDTEVAPWAPRVSTLPRSALVANFSASEEATTFARDQLGFRETERQEVEFVADLFRVAFAGVPDNVVFPSLVKKLQEAQCRGSVATGTAAKEAAKRMFQGTEYVGRTTTPKHFVYDLYDALLRRVASTSEADDWSAAGLGRADILDAILSSKEFKLVTDAIAAEFCTREEVKYVRRLYKIALNREPDATGLMFFLNSLQTAQCQTALRTYAGQNLTPTAIQLLLGYLSSGTDSILSPVQTVAVSIFGSAEYTARRRTAAQTVEDLYQALLQRTAEDAAVAVWVRVIGSAGVGALVGTIVNSQEGFQRNAIPIGTQGCPVP